MLIIIRDRFTDEVIVRGEYPSLASAAEANKADLTRADLTGANLSGADLSEADLRCADLTRANLTGTSLTWASLKGVDLSGANLTGANLIGANLPGARLVRADLAEANLRGANLAGTNLIKANLSKTNLRCADLIGADFRCAIIDETTKMPSKPVELPPVGNEIIGFKKLRYGIVIKVLIPADADRVSSWRSTKCRASAMRVLEVVSNPSGCDTNKPMPGLYDSGFYYTVGKIHFPSNFNPDQRWDCLPGLHFFVNLDEAMRYDS